MAEYPRYQAETDYLAPWQVWEVFLEAPLVRDRKGYFYVFGEYRAYLGPVAMAALGLMLLDFRRRARDYVMIVVLGSLMLGNFAWFSPYALLSRLPVFGSLRVPVRYVIPLSLHVGLVFGHFLQHGQDLAARLRPQRPRVALLLQASVWLVFLGCAIDLVSNNNRQHENFFNTPEPVPRDGPFRMVSGNPAVVHEAPVKNEGHIQCYDPNPIPPARALRPMPESEVYLAAGPGAGAAKLVLWTPNRLRVHVDVATPQLLVVNMNYHRDWWSEDGEVTRYNDLLALKLAPGQREVELYYEPRRIRWYLATSLVGLGLAALAWWGVPRWRRRAGSAAGVDAGAGRVERV
jgi:hypothetical protein